MLDKDTFLKEYHLKEVYQCCKIPWEELEAIYDDYIEQKKELRKKARKLMSLFSDKEITGAHSLRYRIKEPKHLIEKIIRNSAKLKYRNINRYNYNKIITDLVGIRILLFYKEQWESSHDFILANFKDYEKNYISLHKENYNYIDDCKLQCLVEEPKAYIRYGDKDIYRGKLHLEYSNKNYRSLHYSIKYENQYCEIQVRTLAEEIYSEFDHQVRYPYKRDNQFLKEYTAMLSKVTLAADEIVSLCHKMPDEMIDAFDDAFGSEQEMQTKLERICKKKDSEKEKKDKIDSNQTYNIQEVTNHMLIEPRYDFNR